MHITHTDNMGADQEVPGLRKTDADALAVAARALYLAGRWSARGVPAHVQAQLWERLRDTLGLPPGTATARGDGAPLPGESEVEEALSLVYGDRQGDYGSPAEAWGNVAKIWSGLLGPILTRDITAEEAVIMMAAMKLARETNKPKRDNVVDLHGYGVVLSRVKAERSDPDVF